jgi:hypothetical protein
MGFNGWLVVWNIWMIFPFSWECHHPNWSELHHFSDGWLNHQPAVSLHLFEIKHQMLAV